MLCFSLCLAYAEELTLKDYFYSPQAEWNNQVHIDVKEDKEKGREAQEQISKNKVIRRFMADESIYLVEFKNTSDDTDTTQRFIYDGKTLQQKARNPKTVQ